VITRWVQLPLIEGSRFGMGPASVAVGGFEHGIRQVSALGLPHPNDG
jgi:probable phosphoglycerate mutase